MQLVESDKTHPFFVHAKILRSNEVPEWLYVWLMWPTSGCDCRSSESILLWFEDWRRESFFENELGVGYGSSLGR